MAVEVHKIPKRDLPELFRRAHDVRRFDYDNYFRPVPVPGDLLPTVYAKALRPRVYVENGETPTYTLHVHDRLYYTFHA